MSYCEVAGLMILGPMMTLWLEDPLAVGSVLVLASYLFPLDWSIGLGFCFLIGLLGSQCPSCGRFFVLFFCARVMGLFPLFAGVSACFNL